MATEVLLIKEGFKLGAHDPISAETLAEFAQGEVVKATITRPRNVKFHRKFMALIGLIFKSQSFYATSEALRKDVAIASGHKRWEESKFGGGRWVAKSISFANMDETSFGEFFNACVAFITTTVIPGIRDEDIQREIFDLIGY